MLLRTGSARGLQGKEMGLMLGSATLTPFPGMRLGEPQVSGRDQVSTGHSVSHG